MAGWAEGGLPRLGLVPWLNALPLVVGIEDLVALREVPSRLADPLRDGQVDAAIVPIGEALADPMLRLLPSCCIGCDGPVDSVLVVGTSPWKRWRMVAPDPASCTSNRLARHLLKQAVPGIEWTESVADSDARVVIGDPALEGNWSHALDLGALWKEGTGLPFAFAAWVVRADLPDPNRLDEMLENALARGLEVLPTIAHRAASPFGQEKRLEYLRDRLCYRIDQPMALGIHRFAEVLRMEQNVAEARVRWAC